MLSSVSFLVVILSCLTVSQSCDQHSTQQQEYAVKLEYLCKFAEYVRFENPEVRGQVHIAVVGKNPFGEGLSLIQHRRPQGMQCVSHIYESPCQDIKADIIFLPRDTSQETVKQVLAMTVDKSVLLIGEKPGFLQRGGVANLLKSSDGRIQIHVDIQQINRRNLKVDARLMKLSRIQGKK